MWYHEIPLLTTDLWVDGRTSFPPTTLNAYENLQKLCLYSNRLLHDGGLSKLTNLVDLILSNDSCITDAALLRLPRLRSLTLGSPHQITSPGLAALTWLTDIAFIEPMEHAMHRLARTVSTVTMDALISLTRLESLSLFGAVPIGRLHLPVMKYLRVLDLQGIHENVDAVLRNTPCLTALIFSFNTVTDAGLSYVRKHLDILSMGSPIAVTDHGLSKLASLGHLAISNCRCVSGSFLASMIRLREVSITNVSITGMHLSRLPETVRLLAVDRGLHGPVNLSHTHFSKLTGLRSLVLGTLDMSMEGVFRHLTNLLSLKIKDFDEITPRAMSELPLTLLSLNYQCGYGRIKPAIPTYVLTRLTNLTSLHIPYQNDIRASHILQFPELRSLVAGTQATDLRRALYTLRPDLLITERYH